MRLTAESLAEPTFSTHAPAANTAAVVTLAADTEQTHVLDRIWCSYGGSTDPAAAKTLTVAVGGSTVWSVDLPAARAVYEFNLDGQRGAKGKAMVITLPASGDAGCSGKLNTRSR